MTDEIHVLIETRNEHTEEEIRSFIENRVDPPVWRDIKNIRKGEAQGSDDAPTLAIIELRSEARDPEAYEIELDWMIPEAVHVEKAPEPPQ